MRYGSNWSSVSCHRDACTDCSISYHGVLVGGSDFSSNFERSRDIDRTSSDAGSQSTGRLSEVLSQADIWLERAELLQSLLGSRIAASLDDIADKESSPCLHHRLIVDERYSMAVYTCKKCRIDVVPVAWGHALIWQHYAQAHVKFKIRLQYYAQARVKFKYV
ncbi:hypothetical protein FF1_044216 [Malus domestica]